jgi:hypothetical protein
MRGTPLLYLYLYLPSIQRPTFFLLDKFGCSGDNGFIYPSPKEFETSSSLTSDSPVDVARAGTRKLTNPSVFGICCTDGNQ